MTSYGASTHRLLVLDVLRALAVLLVLGHHTFVPPTEFEPLRRFVEAWQCGGWIGVDLFFVLSGFLISGLLFREQQRYGTIRLGRFFVRRGLKLYPAFYLMLAATVVVRLLRGVSVPLQSIVSEMLFVQNYAQPLWGHTWSLAIEEHFYLLLPLLLLVATRKRWSRDDSFAFIPAMFVAVSVSVLALRLGNAYFREYEIRSHFRPTHLRIDALMFGVLLSYLFHYRTRGFRRLFHRRRFWPLMACGLALWAPAFVLRLPESPYLYTVGFTALYVGSGLVLSALLVRGVPDNRFTRAVALVGSHSYSIYLWHLPVKAWGIRSGVGGTGMSPWVVWSVYMASSVGVGILMARWIELPVLRLRDRLVPSRSRSLGEADPGEGLATGEDSIVSPQPRHEASSPASTGAVRRGSPDGLVPIPRAAPSSAPPPRAATPTGSRLSPAAESPPAPSKR